MLKIKIFKPNAPNDVREMELFGTQFSGGEFTIGRLPECNLVLSGSEVSRLHAKITYQNGSYTFVDPGSTCGSWLNEERLNSNQKYILKLGDAIRLADYCIELIAMPNPALDVTKVAFRESPVSASLAKTTIPLDSFMPLARIAPDQISRWEKGDLMVCCHRIIQETVDVKTFCFLANPPVLFTYKPGQFVTLNLEIDGKEVSRSYSISSTPSRPHSLEITVKRVLAPKDEPSAPAGLVSNWLHDNLRVGTSLHLNGPFGKFSCFTKPSQKLLFISAGSGITPMMSMSRWIYDTVSYCDVIFLHSARCPEDIIYRQELESLARRQSHFQLALTMTQADSRQGWLGYTGRISPKLIQAVAPDFCDRTVYVCGPEGFMAGVKTLLQDLHFPMEHYYEESFGAPKKAKKASNLQNEPQQAQVSNEGGMVPQKASPGFGLGAALKGLQLFGTSASVEERNVIQPTPELASVHQAGSHAASNQSNAKLAVVFTKSGKEVACDGEECILDLADQEGVKIRSSCRAGSCGSCKKLKTEGKVKMEGHDPEALTPDEEAAGYILTCMAYPLGRVSIEA